MIQQTSIFFFRSFNWGSRLFQYNPDYFFLAVVAFSAFFFLALFVFVAYGKNLFKFLVNLSEKKEEIDSAFLDRVIKYGTKKTNKKLTDKLIADGVLPSPEDKKKKKEEEERYFKWFKWTFIALVAYIGFGLFIHTLDWFFIQKRKGDSDSDVDEF